MIIMFILYLRKQRFTEANHLPLNETKLKWLKLEFVPGLSLFTTLCLASRLRSVAHYFTLKHFCIYGSCVAQVIAKLKERTYWIIALILILHI